MSEDFTREEALAHFGVKGMKWGVRKQETSGSSAPHQGMSTKKKVLIGTIAVVGTGAAAAILIKGGGIPVSSLSRAASSLKGGFPKNYGSTVKVASPSALRNPQHFGPIDPANLAKGWNLSPAHAQATAARGKKVVDTSAFKKEMETMLKDIADAHAEQTRWMKTQVPGYNARENPFVPASELQRLSHEE